MEPAQALTSNEPFSLEGLDNLFSLEFEDEYSSDDPLDRANDGNADGSIDDLTSGNLNLHSPALHSVVATMIEDSLNSTSIPLTKFAKPDLSASESIGYGKENELTRELAEALQETFRHEKRIVAEQNSAVLKGPLNVPTQPVNQLVRHEGSKINKTDLVSVLEGFVNLIRGSNDQPDQSPSYSIPQIASDSSANVVSVDDKTQEVEDMRKLLVEAQEMIIKLLGDRVEDRSRIAQLESELRMLPDLQAQADRALAAAINTQDFRSDLTKVKFELERFRLARVRHEMQPSRRSWWTGFRGWLFKKV